MKNVKFNLVFKEKNKYICKANKGGDSSPTCHRKGTSRLMS